MVQKLKESVDDQIEDNGCVKRTDFDHVRVKTVGYADVAHVQVFYLFVAAHFSHFENLLALSILVQKTSPVPSIYLFCKSLQISAINLHSYATLCKSLQNSANLCKSLHSSAINLQN
ncbi:hypothetical protein BpHYR1_044318 [Brachionus plicatilis]|uniref:Uncharacterized protein n=1 Tax=Brachionus plicatilis TaxID=10195 RepID=A0A3M7T6S1_BRAPC|nr:hypothetical protein BpHYR1_044318 [Brachionus plicatilis]